MTDVTLSLISHTNVGKTTLARTLLRRDVGEIRDQAHVTEASEAHTLIETKSARLRLWDTPGFGDTRRLLTRLRREGDPIGWFLHQVWDRVADRPLYCSQEAARNIRDEADVVLYLVNASEEPHSAGYVSLELDLLAWMQRPVFLLLNQVGDEDRGAVESWRTYVRDRPVVRDVLSLDAFTRCWVEEDALLGRVVELLQGDKREAMQTLAHAWTERNIAAFRESATRIADYLARAAADREEADESAAASDEGRGAFDLIADALKFTALDKRRAMKTLSQRLDRGTQELMESLIGLHGLEGTTAAATVERRVQDFQVRGAPVFTERSAALAGAVVSGALGGLLADALAGGLTLGGGLIAGGILGALGGSALAKGYRWVGASGKPCVRWSTEFLDQLTRQALLRYLTVAHFGRGRGAFREFEQPAHWHEAVEDALRARRSNLEAIWSQAESLTSTSHETLVPQLAPLIEDVARAVLLANFPHATETLA